MKSPVRRVKWKKTFRIASIKYPPIDIIEDIADPAEWDNVASFVDKFASSNRETLGDLSKVPVNRRVSGPGASWNMAPFLHCAKFPESRFSDSSFGVYYAADSRKTAIAEKAHHYGKSMREERREPQREIFQELIGSIDAVLDNAADQSQLLNHNNYTQSQKFAAQRRAGGSNGIVWPSVRHPNGKCIAVFWPNVIPIPRPGRLFEFFWDGESVKVRSLLKVSNYGF